jgi:hypothetical protein
MFAALTTTRKPHQIATGFDQVSHAKLIGSLYRHQILMRM